MEGPATFGEWLRQRREALHLTRPELAQRVSCAVPTLRKIELGERHPSEQLAQLLAAAIGLAPADHPVFVRVARGELNLERLPPPGPYAGQEAPPAGAATNLPVPITPLVGRAAELAELIRVLAGPQGRLVTLTGPGGIGKTRLALEAAAAYPPAYFVSLASIESAELIPPAIADALEFKFSGTVDPARQLLHYLRDKTLLLLLDNFEHLLADQESGRPAGSCEFVKAILQRAPGVRLVVTSRERLGLHGEWVFDLHGLPVTTESPGDPASSAPSLFVQCAARAQVAFVPAEQDWPAVVRICRLLDGVPLAIELAAAWVPVLSCAEIAAEIERSLAAEASPEILATSLRDVPERHRSMRAVIDHSWRLLSDGEQRALRRLSVFRGGFTRDAAERAAGAPLSVLSALASKSLVQRAGAGRYDLHELVRQYAASQLAAAPHERQSAGAEHGLYFLGMLAERDDPLRSSRQKEVLAELTAEMDNIRAAWDWAAAHAGSERLYRASAALWYLFELHTWFVEGESVFRAAAERLAACAPAERDAGTDVTLYLMRALSAYFGYRQGRLDAAYEALSSGVPHVRASADPYAPSFVLTWLGMVCWALGRFAEADQYLHEGLALAAAHGAAWYQAWDLMGIGNVAHEQGEYARARSHLEGALGASRTTGDPLLAAHVLHCLSRPLQALAEYDLADRLLQESLALARDVGYRVGAGMALDGLGLVAQAKGRRQEAHALFADSCALFREIGEPHQLARVLNHQGLNLLALDDAAGARESFRAALSLAHDSGATSLALDALAGLAALGAGAGAGDAFALACVVLAHPASAQAAKNLAAGVAAQVEPRLPAQQVEAARQRVRAANLTDVIRQVLDRG